MALLASLSAAGCATSAAPPSTHHESTASSTITVSTIATSTVPTTTTATQSRPDLQWAPTPDEVDGFTRLAYTDGDRFVLQTEGGERDFLPGVDLGTTVPGHSPGELAVSAFEYRRWFPMMADLGFRVVRVYTILPPVFYEELERYDSAHPDAPLYLMQGTWIPEEAVYETLDLFDVWNAFLVELTDAVDVVHGDAELADRPGHASGVYTTDVSQWLVGWLIGVEWDPDIISTSDRLHPDQAPFEGTYFSSTPDASPSEIWLAEMLNHVAAEEADRGRTLPIAFTNWPTTDPLDHPEEPDNWFRLAGVDANHVIATEAWPGGTFASYHLYPYYPDFLQLEPGLADFQYDGRTDPYAGYLTALRDHHAEMPLLVTEFGVPSSAALARYEPLGRGQGDHSEQDEMDIDAQLLATIEDLDLAGGFVFEWIDEWFKATWNTMEYEIPADRRQMWQNAWTNESHFGLLAAEPGVVPIAVIDGLDDEWLSNGSQVIYENTSGLREVRAVKDEAYLYLRLWFDDEQVWEQGQVLIGFDVISGGNVALAGTDLDPEADYAVTIGPGSTARVDMRASNDLFAIRYGLVNEYFPVAFEAVLPESGVWDLERLIVRRPIEVPTTDEFHPAIWFDAGDLLFGTTDPNDPAFDSRVSWSAEGHVVELRLPYTAVGFSDPSSLQAYRVLSDGRMATEGVPRLGIGIVYQGTLLATNGYAWESWQSVQWHEREKAGIDVLSNEVWSTVEP